MWAFLRNIGGLSSDEGNETDTESYSFEPQPSLSGIHSYDFRHDTYELKNSKNFVFHPKSLSFI